MRSFADRQLDERVWFRNCIDVLTDNAVACGECDSFRQQARIHMAASERFFLKAYPNQRILPKTFQKIDVGKYGMRD